MQEWNFAEIIIDHVLLDLDLVPVPVYTGTGTCTVLYWYWLNMYRYSYKQMYTYDIEYGTDSSLILSYRGTAFLNRSIPGMMSIDSVLNPDWCYDCLSDCWFDCLHVHFRILVVLPCARLLVNRYTKSPVICPVGKPYALRHLAGRGTFSVALSGSQFCM